MDQSQCNAVVKAAQPSRKLKAANALGWPGVYIASSLVGGAAFANPVGPDVIAGQVSISHPATNVLQVTNSPGAIVNWQGFSIKQNEITRFIQQNNQSAILNRVVGGLPSEILGQIQSNGRVFLINPNGVLFGQNSVVNTAGLIASTLEMNNQDFISGKLAFNGGQNAAAINNKGTLLAENHIVLIAPDIENTGSITVENGNVLLAAGQSVLVTDIQNSNVTYEIESHQSSVTNIGEISAASGSIGMFADTLVHSGQLSVASAHVGDGGSIRLVANGDITLTEGSVVDASGVNGGSLYVDSVQGTTILAGAVDVSGSVGVGGEASLYGEYVGLDGHANINATGAAGGGDVWVGGQWQGGDVHRAIATYVAPDVLVDASALNQGDGGTIAIWSDGTTRSYGRLLATGGSLFGNGGAVETSGKQSLTLGQIAPDVSAANGLAGLWLLDPANIRIIAGTGNISGTGSAPLTFQPSVADSTIKVSLIIDALELGSDVLVQTGSGAMEEGIISVDTAIIFDSGTNDVSLDLIADGDIIINAAITNLSNSGGLDLTLQAGSLTNEIELAANIDTGVLGSVTFTGALFVEDPAIDIVGSVIGNGSISLEGGGLSISSNLTAGTALNLNLLAGSLSLNGTADIIDSVLIQGGTLSVSGTTNVDTLVQEFGTVTGAGKLNIASIFDLQGGTQSGGGTTTVASGSSPIFTISENLNISINGRSIVNNSTNLGNVWSDGSIDFDNGATFTNNGVFAFNVDDGITGAADIINTGTLNITSVADILDIQGTLTISGGSATVNISDNSLVNFATVNVEASGATLNTGINSEVEINTLNQEISTTVNVGSNAELSIGAYTLDGGLLDIGGTVMIENSFDWSSGTVSGSGLANSITVLSGADLTLTSGTKNIDEVLFNTQSMTGIWTGGKIIVKDGGDFTISGQLAVSTSAAIEVATSGDVTIAAGGSYIYTGSGTQLIGPEFDNDGLVDVSIGSIQLLGATGEHGGTFTTLDASTITFGGAEHTFVGKARLTSNASDSFIFVAPSIVLGAAAGTGGLAIDAELSLTDFDFTGPGDLTVENLLSLRGGNSITGGLIVAPGGSVKLIGSTIALGGNASLTVNSLFNNGSLSLDSEDSGAARDVSLTVSTGVLENNGQLNISDSFSSTVPFGGVRTVNANLFNGRDGIINVTDTTADIQTVNANATHTNFGDINISHVSASTSVLNVLYQAGDTASRFEFLRGTINVAQSLDIFNLEPPTTVFRAGVNNATPLNSIAGLGFVSTSLIGTGVTFGGTVAIETGDLTAADFGAGLTNDVVILGPGTFSTVGDITVASGFNLFIEDGAILNTDGGRLTVNGSLNVIDGQVNVNDSGDIAGVLDIGRSSQVTLSGGASGSVSFFDNTTITGGGLLILDGALGAEFDLAGTTTLESVLIGGSAQVDTTLEVRLTDLAIGSASGGSGNIVNQGILRIVGDSLFEVSIDNQKTLEVLDFNGGATPTVTEVVFGAIDNSGSFTTINSASTDITVDIDGAFDNSGMVNVGLGSIDVNLGGEHTGTFSADISGTSINFGGSTNDFGAGVEFGGMGSFNINSGTTTLSSSTTSVKVNLGATLSIDTPNFLGLGSLENNGTINLLGTGSILNKITNNTGANLVVIANSSNTDITLGDIDNDGLLVFNTPTNTGLTLNLNVSGFYTDDANENSAVDVNFGILEFSGGGDFSGSFDTSFSATLDSFIEFSGGVIDFNKGINFGGDGRTLVTGGTVSINADDAGFTVDTLMTGNINRVIFDGVNVTGAGFVNNNAITGFSGVSTFGVDIINAGQIVIDTNARQTTAVATNVNFTGDIINTGVLLLDDFSASGLSNTATIVGALFNASQGISVPITAAGVEVRQSGILAITQGSYTGSFSTLTDGTIFFGAGIHNFEDGSSLNGTGNYSAAFSSQLNFNGDDTGTAVNADITLSGILSGDGLITNNANLTFVQTSTFTDGKLINTGTVSVDSSTGAASLTVKEFQNNGTLELINTSVSPSSSSLIVTSSNDTSFGGIGLVNNGVISSSGPGSHSITADISSSAGAAINITNNDLSIDANGALIDIDGTVTSASSLSVSNGDVAFSAALTQSATSNLTFSNVSLDLTGSSFTGGGELTLDLLTLDVATGNTVILAGFDEVFLQTFDLVGEGVLDIVDANVTVQSGSSFVSETATFSVRSTTATPVDFTVDTGLFFNNTASSGIDFDNVDVTNLGTLSFTGANIVTEDVNFSGNLISFTDATIAASGTFTQDNAGSLLFRNVSLTNLATSSSVDLNGTTTIQGTTQFNTATMVGSTGLLTLLVTGTSNVDFSTDSITNDGSIVLDDLLAPGTGTTILVNVTNAVTNNNSLSSVLNPSDDTNATILASTFTNAGTITSGADLFIGDVTNSPGNTFAITSFTNSGSVINNTGDIEIYAATITNSGTISTVSDDLEMIADTFTNTLTGVINSTNDEVDIEAETFTNAGALNATGDEAISSTTSVRFDIAVDTFTNTGTISIDAENTESFFEPFNNAASTVTNSGAITVAAGSISVGDANFTNAVGATIGVTGGTFEASQITSSSIVNTFINNGTITVNPIAAVGIDHHFDTDDLATFTNNGLIELLNANADADIDATQIVNSTTGVIRVVNGLLTLDSITASVTPSFSNSGSFSVIDGLAQISSTFDIGTLTNQSSGTFVVGNAAGSAEGQLDIDTENFSNIGTFTLFDGPNTTPSVPRVLLLADTITNSGTLNVGDFFNTDSDDFNNTGTINITDTNGELGIGNSNFLHADGAFLNASDDGVFTLRSSNLLVSFLGDVDSQDSSTIIFDGSAIVFDGVTLSGSGFFDFRNDFSILSGDIAFSATVDSAEFEDITIGGAGEINNSGVLDFLGTTNVNVTINNLSSGTINITSDDDINSNVSFDNLVSSSGSLLTLGGGTGAPNVKLDITQAFTNNGTIRVFQDQSTAGIRELTADFTNAGLVELIDTDFDIVDADGIVNTGIINLAGSLSTTPTAGGNLNIETAGTNALAMQSGTIDLAGNDLNLNGDKLTWTSGAFNGSGNILASEVIFAAGSKTFNGPTLALPNLILGSGDTLLLQNGTINLASGAVFTIASGAELEINNNVLQNGNGGTNDIDGTLRLINSNLEIDAAFIDGSIILDGSMLIFDSVQFGYDTAATVTGDSTSELRLEGNIRTGNGSFSGNGINDRLKLTSDDIALRPELTSGIGQLNLTNLNWVPDAGDSDLSLQSGLTVVVDAVSMDTTTFESVSVNGLLSFINNSSTFNAASFFLGSSASITTTNNPSSAYTVNLGVLTTLETESSSVITIADNTTLAVSDLDATVTEAQWRTAAFGGLGTLSFDGVNGIDVNFDSGFTLSANQTLTAIQANLMLNGSSTLGGDLNLQGTSTLDFGAGTQTLNSGLTLTGVNNNVVNLPNLLTLSSSPAITPQLSGLAINSSSSILSGGPLNVSNSTWSISSSLNIDSAATLILDQVDVTGLTALVFASGDLSFTGGNSSFNVQDINIDSGSTLSLSNPSSGLLDVSFNTSGTFSVSGALNLAGATQLSVDGGVSNLNVSGYSGSGALDFQNGALNLTNSSGFTVAANQSLSLVTNPLTVNQQFSLLGSLNASASALMLNGDSNLAGNISLSGATTLNLSDLNSHNLQSGLTLSGDNIATVNLPTIVTINSSTGAVTLNNLLVSSEGVNFNGGTVQFNNVTWNANVADLNIANGANLVFDNVQINAGDMLNLNGGLSFVGGASTLSFASANAALGSSLATTVTEGASLITTLDITNSLTLAGPVSVNSGATLRVNNATTTITANNYTGPGTLSFFSGQTNVGSSFTLADDQTITLDANPFTTTGQFNLNGFISASNSNVFFNGNTDLAGNIDLSNSSLVSFGTSGSHIVSDDVSITATAETMPGGTFSVSNTTLQINETKTLSINSSNTLQISDATINGGGQIALAGNALLSNVINLDNNFNVLSGATLSLDNTLSVGAGVFTINGSLVASNNASLAHSVIVASDGEVKLGVSSEEPTPDNSFALTLGALTNSGSINTVAGGTRTLSTTSFTNSGSITNTDTDLVINSSGGMNIAGNIISNGGDITLANSNNSATLSLLNPDLEIADNRRFALSSALLDFNSLTVSTGSLDLTANSTVNLVGNTDLSAVNLSTQTVAFTGDGSLLLNNASISGNASIGSNNSLTAGDGTINTTGDFTINGTALLQGTTIAASNVLINNGAVSGNGTLGTNVFNNGGSLSPGFSPGAIVVAGNYTQDANGTLFVELGLNENGTGVAGQDFDSLTIGGVAQINGTIDVTLLDNIDASDGTSVSFISSSSFDTTAQTNIIVRNSDGSTSDLAVVIGDDGSVALQTLSTLQALPPKDQNTVDRQGDVTKDRPPEGGPSCANLSGESPPGEEDPKAPQEGGEQAEAGPAGGHGAGCGTS